MHLSEAVREGSRFGDVRGRVINPWGDGCCAIGGAFLALGMSGGEEDAEGHKYGGSYGRFEHLAEKFPEAALMPPCPVCGEKVIGGIIGADPYSGHYEGYAIECLFENHKWSKPAIAEWVEAQERRLGLWDEPKVSEPVEPVKAPELLNV